MSDLIDSYSSAASKDTTKSHILLDSPQVGALKLSNVGNLSLSGGTMITNDVANKYIKQWTTFKSELSSFLEKSRIPAKYNDPKSSIHSLREKLLEYELMEFESFTDPGFIKDLIEKLQIKNSRFRIFKGIKSLQDIVNDIYGGDLETAMKEDGVVQYLIAKRKSYISCVVIMVTLKK